MKKYNTSASGGFQTHNSHLNTDPSCIRHIHSFTLSQAKDKVVVGREEAERLIITKADFDHALQYDLKPAFGISDEQLDRYVFNGACSWNNIDYCHTEGGAHWDPPQNYHMNTTIR